MIMIKHFLLSFLLGLTLFLAGCYETTEELTINQDGSGSYNTTIDLSGLFQLFDTMKGMDSTLTISQNKGKEKVDTTINMKDFSDTATNLTMEEKGLLRPATMKMVMDDEAKQFKLKMNFPFTQLGDVPKIIKLMQSKSASNTLGKMVLPGDMAGNGNTPKMPDYNSYFDVTFKPHLIERKLNVAKYKSLNQDLEQNGMEEGSDALSSIKMNTIIHLPAMAKSAVGEGVKLATDKKTVTISGTMEDLMKSPQKFSYRIEY